MDEPRPPWGWFPDCRRFLALGVLGIAAAILVTGPDRGAPAPPPGVAAPVVDPNTAPPAVLLSLPGLGPARVDALIEAREAAPFVTLEDLDRRVEGIGPATLDGLRPFLRIDPPATGDDGGAPSTTD